MASLLNVQSYLGECSNFFACLGVLAGLYLALKSFCGVCRLLRDYFVGPVLGLSADLKKAGSWAVVTGCTDGIGKAYAQQLAKRGLNVVLISRTQSKLDDLAKEIESKYSVQTKTIAADFTKTDIYDRIEKDLGGLEIGTLVNNVGMSYEFPLYFLEPEMQRTRDLLNCNMLSTISMTRMCLPGMVERHCGYIINIASAAAEGPVPLLTVYSASKAFMDFFSRGLQIEYKNKGITVQSVRPGFVATKMSGIRRSNIIAPYPDQFVRAALGTVGITSSTSGFWIHQIQSFISSVSPGFIAFNFMKKVRARALARKEQKKAQ